jgi:hypothetical protein
MRSIHYVYIPLVFAVMLFGCVPSTSPIPPTVTETQIPSLTLVPPTASSAPTSTPRSTPTTTLTPPATLEPKQARETIKTLLEEPIDCAAPCFWGIMPGQSTLGEANNIFIRLGLQLKYVNTLDHKAFYEVDYGSDNSFSIRPNLAIQSDIVKYLTLYINPETQKVGVPRTWSAYSPETLINRYGSPSKVNFNVDRGESPSYGMVMYFNAEDLIVEYYSYDLGAKLQVCPPTDQMDSVRLWMGKDPENPPLEDVPLEKATSMTLKEFSKLMTSDPNTACFDLKEEMFQ